MKKGKAWIIVGGIVLLVVAGGGYYYWLQQASRLPDGIVSGNGRIEAEQVDIATKFPGRIEAILVKEGDLVDAGDILAHMDSKELQARLNQAKAATRQARQKIKEAEAQVTLRQSERHFAEQELGRALTLVQKGHVSQEVVDERQTQKDTADAALAAVEAQLETAKTAVDLALAQQQEIEVDLEDSILIAPVRGRIQYRLTEPREVLGAGGKVLTLLDLTNSYMTIFLPTEEAGQTSIGTEAHIVLDALPDTPIPAKVTFVAAKAQFTPKEVETQTERGKLMFRVKVQINPDLVEAHIEKVKTGLPGVAYLRLDPTVTWPEMLQTSL